MAAATITREPPPDLDALGRPKPHRASQPTGELSPAILDALREGRMTPGTLELLTDEQITALYEKFVSRPVATPQLSLKEFIVESWHAIEPLYEFVDSWHIDAICEHLEAVTNGQIDKLGIAMPPRAMKTLTVSVCWPAWIWTFRPEARFLYSSYGLDVALDSSVKCRNLIRSEWYQKHFGHVFRISREQDAKARFDNDKTGSRVCVGVGGPCAGLGGDVVVGDDLHKIKESESEVLRTEAVRYWMESLSTRRNQLAGWGGHVLMMQRTHAADTLGEVIAREMGYDLLILPMRYEDTETARSRVTSIGFRDPRKVDGELLSPKRFSETAVTTMEKTLGEYAFAAQYQQRPVPRGGGMFKREWFEIVKASPASAKQRVRYWDTAGASARIGGKANPHGDYTVGILMSRDEEGYFYVEDMVRGQWGPYERNVVILQTAAVDAEQHGRVQIWVEEPPGLAKESTTSIVKMLAAFGAKADRVQKDKIGRAEDLEAQSSAKNVKLVKGKWNADWLDQITVFPYGKWDDVADGTSGAFNKVALTRVWGFS